MKNGGNRTDTHIKPSFNIFMKLRIRSKKNISTYRLPIDGIFESKYDISIY